MGGRGAEAGQRAAGWVRVRLAGPEGDALGGQRGAAPRGGTGGGGWAGPVAWGGEGGGGAARRCPTCA